MAWSETEDANWVLAAQAGDLAAFDRLAARYRPAGLMIAKRVLNSSEGAEDSVQDALLSAYKSLPTLRDPTRFAVWFSAIVRNRALRTATAPESKNEPWTEHLDRIILKSAPSILRDVPMETTPMVDALERLTEDLKEVAVLYYVHDWPVSTISKLLGLPTTTVKWRLNVTRSQLRRWFSCQENS
jgi:RNA polymerase sigma-70 factor (ECF subfamily)